MVCAPLKAADLLAMALQAALGLQRRRADVPLQDHAVAAARRQLVCVPCQRACRGERGGGANARLAKRNLEMQGLEE